MEPSEVAQMMEVWVRWTQEGWHNWPEAPERRAYLRDSHRHLFWYEVRVNITGLGHNRSLEFHNLLEFCREATRGPNLGANSCEMLAAALGEDVRVWLLEMGVEAICTTVTVSEDNECGSTVTVG